MPSEHSFSALRAHERTTAALMTDLEITGDLLLVGLWLSRAVHLHAPAPTGESGWHLVDIARDVFPLTTWPAMFADNQWTHVQETGFDAWRVVEVLKTDIRRYDVWVDHPGRRGTMPPCGGPMIRREVCGKRAQTGSFLTNPETGRRSMVGACSRHHDWYHQQCRENRAALKAAEVPRPPANAGGHLARHIDIDWPALWIGLSPEWTAPPEMDSWSRPKLQLLAGDLGSLQQMAGAPVKPRTPRPRFAVIDGAMTTPDPILT